MIAYNHTGIRLIIGLVLIGVLGLSEVYAEQQTQESQHASLNQSSSEPSDDYSVNPPFSQKAGMLRPGDHSVYIRTNDEYTSFSTFLAGYRYAATDHFQFALEAGLGIHVFLASWVMHIKLFESANDFLFIGLRTRTGFKKQDTYIPFNEETGFILDDHRLGFFAAADLTVAFRFGDRRRYAVYYTIYPLLDIDITGRALEIYLAPVHIGYEFRFRNHPSWSFAIEAGFFFPLNAVPDTSWVRFPNLANAGIYYRF